MDPSIENVLKVMISPSINQKLSKVSERRSCDMNFFTFVRVSAIIVKTSGIFLAILPLQADREDQYPDHCSTKHAGRH